jgi:hypothetical protein
VKVDLIPPLLSMEFGGEIAIIIIAPGLIESEMTKGKVLTPGGKNLRHSSGLDMSAGTTRMFADLIFRHLVATSLRFWTLLATSTKIAPFLHIHMLGVV